MKRFRQSGLLALLSLGLVYGCPGAMPTNSLKLWLSAEVFSGMTNGQPIAGWADRSDRRHDGTALGTPQYQAKAIGSQPAVQFREADGPDGFTFGNLSAEFPNGATLFVVARLDNEAAFNLFVTGENDSWWRWDSTRRGYFGVFRKARLEDYWAAIPTSDAYIFEIQSSSNRWELFINGSSLGVAGGDYSAGDNAFGLGTGPARKALNGAIGEVLAYARVLDLGERNAAGNYLATKYALASAYAADTPPQSIDPTPADEAFGCGTNVVLRWDIYAAGRSNLAWNVYCGTNATFPEGPRLSRSTQKSYRSDFLHEGQAYYWRVDVVNPDGAVFPGVVREFHTAGYWPADIFARWGLEAMRQVEADHRKPGTWFYEHSCPPDNYTAFAWDMLVQLRTLNYAARVDLDRFLGPLTNTLTVLESYWNTNAASGRHAYSAYPTASPDTELYTDDNAWLAVPLLRAYELTGNRFFLRRAKNALDFALSLEHPVYGGIMWRSAFPTNETPILGSSSTTGTAQAAVEYYALTGDITYLKRALRLLDWLGKRGTMTDSDGLVWPSMFTNGVPNKYNKFSYDSAVPLQVYLKLHALTGNEAYLTKAMALARAIETRWVDARTGGIRDDSCFAFTVVEAYLALYQTTADKHWLDVCARALHYVHNHLRDAKGRYAATWWEVPYAPVSPVLLIGSGSQPLAYYAAAALNVSRITPPALKATGTGAGGKRKYASEDNLQ